MKLKLTTEELLRLFLQKLLQSPRTFVHHAVLRPIDNYDTCVCETKTNHCRIVKIGFAKAVAEPKDVLNV